MEKKGRLLFPRKEAVESKTHSAFIRFESRTLHCIIIIDALSSALGYQANIEGEIVWVTSMHPGWWLCAGVVG